MDRATKISPKLHRRVARGLVLLVAVTVASGCLILDADLELSYAPRGAARCGADSNIALALQAYDTRIKADRIGVKKNGVGTEMADVKLDRAGGVSSWFRDATRKELQRAGLRILEPGGLGGGYLRVIARLKQLFAEALAGRNQVHAIMLVELEVIFADGSRFARLFKGYKKGTLVFGTDGEIESPLLAAAQRALGKATRALCGLIAMERGR